MSSLDFNHSSQMVRTVCWQIELVLKGNLELIEYSSNDRSGSKGRARSNPSTHRLDNGDGRLRLYIARV